MTKTVAILATHGVEEVELLKPWKKLEKSGVKVVLVTPESGKIQSMKGDIKPRKKYRPDMTIAEGMRERFDGLVLPGGTVNADSLRGDPNAVAFVKKFVKAKAPIAVICHGAWILIEAKGVKSRIMTSWPSLKTDLTHAGARWRDVPLAEDGNMISSRNPDDLPVFCNALIRQYQPTNSALTASDKRKSGALTSTRPTRAARASR